MRRSYTLAMMAGDKATVNRQTRNNGGGRDPAAAAERFSRLAKGWMAEDPAYDKEAWPELRESLDRNRPEYRKHFPDQDRPAAAEG
jgi:hypothetical protein